MATLYTITNIYLLYIYYQYITFTHSGGVANLKKFNKDLQKF